MVKSMLLLLLIIQMSTFESKVVGIQDGDTVELITVYDGVKAKNRSGKNLRIRFAHIDCPEKGQPFYQTSKNFTANACFGKTVKIIHRGEFDRYGRLIAEIVLPNGKILNQELVRNGLAIHFKKYSSSIVYANLEIDARKNRLGIWEY